MLGVSGVVLNDQGQILLLSHRYWKEGSWGLPSGYAIKREKLQQTLEREIKEETGLDVRVTRLIRIVTGYKLRIEANLTATLIGGTLKIDKKEVIDARFFDRKSLPPGLLPAHREIIELAFASAMENVSPELS